jgi:hypothetical protein
MADPVRVARDLSRLAEGEVVLIGGVATYLHVQRRPKVGLPLETTHAADAAILTLTVPRLPDRGHSAPSPS